MPPPHTYPLPHQAFRIRICTPPPIILARFMPLAPDCAERDYKLPSTDVRKELFKGVEVSIFETQTFFNFAIHFLICCYSYMSVLVCTISTSSITLYDRHDNW